MLLFGLLMSLASSSYGPGKGAMATTNGFEDCVLQSTVHSSAGIRWYLSSEPGAPIGFWRCVLDQGGQIKAELTASRFQGYGSSIWNHVDSGARSETLLPFVSSKLAYGVAARADVDGVLFTGKVTDFYYSGECSNQPIDASS